MPRATRSEPMPVRHWSFAGLLITYRCNARCASCYLCCGPECDERMDVESAVAIWRGLIEASPHGCKVHISGGEPFTDWPLLIEICMAAKQAGLGPLAKVETNAFWAADEPVVRRYVTALDHAGMDKLCISVDPYHQQYVPLERARLAAAVAEDILGAGRVQVRWRDWLEDGFDTGPLSPANRERVFREYAARGRDRFNGRAAESLAPHVELKPIELLADNPCRGMLLRGRHVHVDGAGRVMPGTCAGILLGACGRQTVSDLWRRLNEDHATRPIVGALAARGPAGLLERAGAAGFTPARQYAGKCHLCWDVRRWFVRRGMHERELGPRWLYHDGDRLTAQTEHAGQA